MKSGEEKRSFGNSLKIDGFGSTEYLRFVLNEIITNRNI